MKNFIVDSRLRTAEMDFQKRTTYETVKKKMEQMISKKRQTRTQIDGYSKRRTRRIHARKQNNRSGDVAIG